MIMTFDLYVQGLICIAQWFAVAVRRKGTRWSSHLTRAALADSALTPEHQSELSVDQGSGSRLRTYFC
jgi:hypothetical protein